MAVRNDSKEAVARARTLRKALTPCERMLWNRLRRRTILFRFRKQYPAFEYFLDFYCPTAKVCVEVDGDSHYVEPKRDVSRDRRLVEGGILTLRFTNPEIRESLDAVVEEVFDACAKRCAVPRVPPP